MFATTYLDLPDPDTQPEFYADVPMKRLLAWVVDAVLTGIAVVVILPFTAFTGLFFLPFLWMCVGFAYRWFTLASGSATLGMRLMSIELRDRFGRRLDAGTGFLHTMGYTVSLAFPLLQLASIVMMVTGRRAQGLTDTLMGTVAINRRAAA